MGITREDILSSIKKATEHQLNLRAEEGYWWYTLEANESICAEALFLMHFMGEVDEAVQAGLARRILSCQRPDGTWALYYGGPPDLSTTIECYWALKLCSVVAELALPSSGKASFATTLTTALSHARDFILSSGGITHARVFTKIHLAQFGLIPWSACPAMPVELMLMPTWATVNIYEFSSWARACIIPLLVVMNKKPVRPLLCHPEQREGSREHNFTLNELFSEPANERNWHYKTDKAFLSWDRFFINLNKFLRLKEFIPNPLEGVALKKCEEWICEHIAKTEDIYPALAYGAMALSALGHSNSHPMIRKALNALKSFQQVYEGDDLPTSVSADLNTSTLQHSNTAFIHQQCCISPVWDTPWQITALLEAGVPADHPALLKSGRWLISKQITKTCGDWKFKSPNAEPGGWSFEFENEFFPDVDDTIQVLHVLNRLALPEAEKKEPIERGLKWLLSMQNDDGGWGAFDKNQTLELVNKIPFSDHGACLDPSSPDIAGRMLTLLGACHCEESAEGGRRNNPVNSGDRHASLPPKGRRTGAMTKALDYLQCTQEPFGAWSGRWGVNYIYGTWCVLTGLAFLDPLPSLFKEEDHEGWLSRIRSAAEWLISIQHDDGGWSEDPFTYKLQRYAPYPRIYIRPESVVNLSNDDGRTVGIPSQTAWALMGLIAARSVILSDLPAGDLVAGAKDPVRSKLLASISRGVEFLIKRLKSDGTWDEREFTGTGFPNHFYIRYHGYRHFFPLLALGKYYRSAGL